MTARPAEDYSGRYTSQAAPDMECRHCGSETCEGDCLTRRDFETLEDGYRMTVPGLGIELRVDRLRREHHTLVGELAVKCRLPGARTVGDNLLSVSDLNLSSQRARQDRARFVAGRARLDDDEADWVGLIEEFSQRVIEAERKGSTGVLLRDIPRPRPDDVHLVHRLPLLARHPTILFGDGGAAKSYRALYCAGELDRQGLRVGLFDWELAGEDHRDRLERLFGGDLPAVRYARCDRPLVHEVGRVRRIIRGESLDFAIFDSIAFACDGPPEAAEVASRYFQALRQVGSIGSLHIAHISKAEGADRKPFGSTFWHNGARATWFAKVADTLPSSDHLTLGLYNRKANLGGVRAPVGFEITFGEERTEFRRVEVADIPDLAEHLSTRQRMAHALRHGAMTADELSSEIDADAETIKRNVRRYKHQFTVLAGGRIGLAQGQS